MLDHPRMKNSHAAILKPCHPRHKKRLTLIIIPVQYLYDMKNATLDNYTKLIWFDYAIKQSDRAAAPGNALIA